MHYLSEGWPSKYKPDTLARRASGRYAERAALYTWSSQKVGDIRTSLVQLAADKGVQPPLTRRDVRLSKRNEELRKKLGVAGMELLQAHQAAVDANYEAMSNLRGEAGKLAARITGTQHARVDHEHHPEWQTSVTALHAVPKPDNVTRRLYHE